ncbi:MAG: TIGR03960 family B12-binding radical SAM protein [Bacillota bacterium]
MSEDFGEVIEDMLPRVRRPARYIGGELNSISPRWDEHSVKMVLSYPDLYEVGTSHLGLSILYSVINSHPQALAERVYSPDLDMEAELRRRGVPLFSLESRTPVGDFDFLGITLQYELTYTNVLNLLELGGIPLLADERKEGDPFVIGGGPCVANPEPVAPFFDMFLLGDGEEAVVELVDAFRIWRDGGGDGGREAFLRSVADIEGIYVPYAYEATYEDDGSFAGVKALLGFPPRVRRRIILDLEDAPVPTHPIVPYVEAVHDRAVVEIFRGCTRGCRFCMPGMTYRPVRERSPENLRRLTRDILANTGYEEISLVSLSSSDYSAIGPTTEGLSEELSPQNISISLPSLRVDDFSVELAGRIREVRKTGITLAPEAGTQRLRDVINKGVTEEDFESALRTAFGSGCDQLKLYFMIGLPTETDEDVRGIAEMVHKARELFSDGGSSRRPLRLNLSVACFIPKPHTPFQWEPQIGVEEFRRRVRSLRERLPRKGVKLSYHDPVSSRIEAVLSRGDRRLAPVIAKAHSLGARLEGWTEHFDGKIWENAFRETGIDPDHYVDEQELGVPLPWDHLDTRVSREFLLFEREKAFSAETTPDCRWNPCSLCGVCSGRVSNEVIFPDVLGAKG